MSVFDSAEFHAALAGVTEAKESALSSLRQERAALARELAQHQKEKEKRDRARAAAARRGDFGPERQQLQRRIDAGETTWADVRSGRDTHPTAVAVRAFSERNLTDLASQLRSDPVFLAAQEDLSRTLGVEPDAEEDRPR